MNSRTFKIKNFKNIGIGKEDTYNGESIYLNFGLNKEELGGLIVLLGENNVGKTNILKALECFSSQKVNSEYRPNYFGYENDPALMFEYIVENKEENSPENVKNDKDKFTKYEITCTDKGLISTMPLVMYEEYDIHQIKGKIQEIFDVLKRKKGLSEKDLMQVECIRSYISKRDLINGRSDEDYQFLKKSYKDIYNIYKEKVTLSYPYSAELDFAVLDKIPKVKHEELEDVIEKQFNISAFPNIYMDDIEEITGKDLETSPSELEKSSFFCALFKSIDVDIKSTVLEHYNKAKEKQSSAFYKKCEAELNKKIKECISDKFENLYCMEGHSGSRYTFELNFEEQKITFDIYKNISSENDKGDAVSLDEQSLGFKWLFNFFFNFLHNKYLCAGDIVLIDELGANLSIPSQKKLRRFLKEFGRNNGILFIVATHSPFFIDMDHLDEIRIIKNKSNGKGVEIINDFSVSHMKNHDTISEILFSLGVHYLHLKGDVKDRLIFVEGLLDYNYLTAFKEMYEKENIAPLNIIFLPVNGLGNTSDTQTHDKAIEDLLKLANKLAVANPVLLVDSDKAGQNIENQNTSSMRIISISEVFDSSKIQIEDMFSSADRDKFNISSKNGKESVVFKNKANLHTLIDDETKANFYKLLEYIAKS